MLRVHLIAEVEAMLPGPLPTPEIRGVVDVRELRRRLALALGSIEPRLCQPPCRDGTRRLDQHAHIGTRCCETKATWWITASRGERDGTAASLAGLVVLLAERQDLGEFEVPLRALASTLLADGHATPPEDCGFGRCK